LGAKAREEERSICLVKVDDEDSEESPVEDAQNAREWGSAGFRCA
jgi:hypothetical protein